MKVDTEITSEKHGKLTLYCLNINGNYQGDVSMKVCTTIYKFSTGIADLDELFGDDLYPSDDIMVKFGRRIDKSDVDLAQKHVSPAVTIVLRTNIIRIYVCNVLIKPIDIDENSSTEIKRLDQLFNHEPFNHIPYWFVSEQDSAHDYSLKFTLSKGHMKKIKCKILSEKLNLKMTMRFRYIISKSCVAEFDAKVEHMKHVLAHIKFEDHPVIPSRNIHYDGVKTDFLGNDDFVEVLEGILTGNNIRDLISVTSIQPLKRAIN